LFLISYEKGKQRLLFKLVLVWTLELWCTKLKESSPQNWT
jgi:hypothetical protein